MSPDADDLLARQLQQLRGEYLADADKRLAELREIRAQLRTDALEALGRLRQAFHRLAGSGGSYGFPDISANSREGEHVAQRLQAAGASSSAADLDAIDACIAGVDRAFREAKAGFELDRPS